MGNFSDLLKRRLIFFRAKLFFPIMMLCLPLIWQPANALGEGRSSFTFAVEGQSLKQAFEIIKEKTGYKVFFKATDIDVEKVVNFSFKEGSIEQIMKSLLKGTGLEFKVIDTQILVYPKKKIEATKPAQPAVPQQQKRLMVTGKVVGLDGVAIPGVNVLEKGTMNGAPTDVNGTFKLEVEGKESVLVITFMGMKTQEITVGNRTFIDVVLAEDADILEEVVVIGYGTAKKVNLTGSVATVNASDISSKRPVTNLSAALSGNVPGVIITTSNNTPGNNGGANIKIRGEGTLNNSSPLVIIDGMEGSLSDVVPQDVESMSVLKDAASASIYGSRAANGVILITTKQGASGRMKASYNGYMSIQDVSNKVGVVSNYADYMEIVNEAFTNGNESARFSQEKIDEWRNAGDSDPIKYPNNDWQDVLFSSAISQQHNLSFSGGTDKMRYFISGNYLHNPGIMENSAYEKFSVRVNVDADVKKWLNVGIQINGSYDDQEPGSQYNDNGSSQLKGLFNKDSTTPGMVHKHDGKYGVPNNNEEDPQATNLMKQLYSQDGENNNTKNRLRLYATLKPFKGMTLKTSLSYNTTNRVRWHKPTLLGTYNFYDDEVFSESGGRSSITFFEYHTKRLFMDAYANYEKKFIGQRLGMNLMAGVSEEQYYSDVRKSFRYDLLYNDARTLNGATGESVTSGGLSEWAMRSFFFRANFNFDEKYLLELNMRSDGSSRFSEDNRWGYFPSASIGWRISEEAFLADVAWIDQLKVRASYGSLGNNAIGNYDTDPTYNKTAYVIGGEKVAGVYTRYLKNTALEWESTYVANVGLDFGLFKNRLTGSVEVFDKQTTNILYKLPAPLLHGYADLPKSNTAEVSNKGIEVQLGYNGTIGSDFEYSVGGNVSYIHNEVTKFKDGELAQDKGGVLLEGERIGAKYILEFDRIIQTQEDLDLVETMIEKAPIDEATGEKANPFKAYGKPGLGDVLYKDINGDGVINDDDRVIQDYNGVPKVTFGINLSASWKGIDFSMLMEGAAGHRQEFKPFGAGTLRYGRTVYSEYIDGRFFHGREVESSPASYPALYNNSRKDKNLKGSTLWYHDKDYLRIKNIQLGYTIPQKFTKRMGEHVKLRVYGTLENYFTFTEWPGIDPEVGGVGYPLIKQAVFGVNLNF
ncbi:SusC/RagA family TonB-linked outer membrane protein [Fulvitalea axinellae]|uniref:SusC/RagA family TonB-linked outer membrane protein n=1 Tax=Fulvitalea axinellae TaxID=1182444 RepID=A0AAU9CQS0_9BACT|nr:SusC/RagA family TonB-linked outer membrane protein [Fulvitalea axinellae]